MLTKLSDLLLLQLTRDPIDPEERQRKWIETESGGVEAWTLGTSERDPERIDLLESLKKIDQDCEEKLIRTVRGVGYTLSAK